jgi:hypothetical protein
MAVATQGFMNQRTPILAGVATAAAGAFAWLAILERDGRLAKADGDGLEQLAATSRTHERAAQRLHPLGKWWSYLPAAVAAGATIYARGSGPRHERAAGAGAVLMAAAAGALACPVFDRVLPQPPTPPGRRSESHTKPTFPSGHATGLGAVAMTAAYVLRRERVVGPAAAVPLGVAAAGRQRAGPGCRKEALAVGGGRRAARGGRYRGGV